MDWRRNVFKSCSNVCKYLIAAVVLCALCFLFPYTQDDWAWGSAIGLRRLAKWFENYNGRYLGNLIVLALTRSRVLRAAVMGIAITGIIYCIERITQKRWAFTSALLGFLFMPRLITLQAVVWTSGFSNYVTSAFLTLVFFVYLNEHRPEENCRVSFMTCIFLAVLGLCNTLIVEHLTVFHVIISVFLFVYSYRILKKIRTDYLIYMFGTITGAFYMLSNSAYHFMDSNPDGYTHVASDGLVLRALKNYFGMIYHEGYYNNHV